VIYAFVVCLFVSGMQAVEFFGNESKNTSFPSLFPLTIVRMKMTFSPELAIRHVLRANCFFVCRFKKQVKEFRSPVAVLEWEEYSTWILCRPLEVGYFLSLCLRFLACIWPRVSQGLWYKSRYNSTLCHKP